MSRRVTRSQTICLSKPPQHIYPLRKGKSLLKPAINSEKRVPLGDCSANILTSAPKGTKKAANGKHKSTKAKAPTLEVILAPVPLKSTVNVASSRRKSILLVENVDNSTSASDKTRPASTAPADNKTQAAKRRKSVLFGKQNDPDESNEYVDHSMASKTKVTSSRRKSALLEKQNVPGDNSKALNSTAPSENKTQPAKRRKSVLLGIQNVPDESNEHVDHLMPLNSTESSRRKSILLEKQSVPGESDEHVDNEVALNSSSVSYKTKATSCRRVSVLLEKRNVPDECNEHVNNSMTLNTTTPSDNKAASSRRRSILFEKQNVPDECNGHVMASNSTPVFDKATSSRRKSVLLEKQNVPDECDEDVDNSMALNSKIPSDNKTQAAKRRKSVLVEKLNVPDESNEHVDHSMPLNSTIRKSVLLEKQNVPGESDEHVNNSMALNSSALSDNKSKAASSRLKSVVLEKQNVPDECNENADNSMTLNTTTPTDNKTKAAKRRKSVLLGRPNVPVRRSERISLKHEVTPKTSTVIPHAQPSKINRRRCTVHSIGIKNQNAVDNFSSTLKENSTSMTEKGDKVAAISKALPHFSSASKENRKHIIGVVNAKKSERLIEVGTPANRVEATPKVAADPSSASKENLTGGIIARKSVKVIKTDKRSQVNEVATRVGDVREIIIPDELKRVLLSDSSYIIRQKKLYNFPTNINVAQVIEEYVARQINNIVHSSGISKMQVFESILNYFDSLIGVKLLYDSERAQYEDMLRNFPGEAMSKIYPPIYLLRLLVHLMHLPFSERDTETLEWILEHINEFIKYLDENKAVLFDLNNLC